MKEIISTTSKTQAKLTADIINVHLSEKHPPLLQHYTMPALIDNPVVLDM